MRSLRLPQLFGVLGVAGTVLLTSTLALAQDDQQAPAHVAFVDGAASLDREGQTEPATSGVPFVAGDRIRTERGRVEVMFPDGSALDIDQFASVELLGQTLLRVTEGRILLTVAGADNPSAALRYQVDTPAASAFTEGPGEFRVALLSTPSGLETELAVLRGFASLSTERGSVNVRAGERTLARDNESPQYPQLFNSARFDAFDRWAEQRRADRTRTTASNAFLPDDLRMYGRTFDRYGAWQYEPSYGYVWFPTVAYDWRPYYYGYWSSIRPYGWTWIGYDAWGWPTHHYGRWGHVRNRWFWIPQRRWAAAWVSWGAAPGYVSWCPLGFNNRPVFALSVTVGHPWAGWVVVPRTHFGGYRVNDWAVASHRVHNAPFATLASSPVPTTPTYAVPRAVAMGGNTAGVAGRYAIPRNGVNAAVGSSQSVQGEAAGARNRTGIARRPLQSGAAATSALDSNRIEQGNRSAVVRNPRGADSRTSPPATIPLPVDRTRPSAVPRQPGEAGQWQRPGAAVAPSAAPSIERSEPVVRRPRTDSRFGQPLPQSPALPQSRPLPQTTPLYQRAPSRNADDVYQAPQNRETMPRWRMPGGAAAQPQGGAPPASVPPSSVPAARPSPPARSAVPRWEGYSRPPAASAPPSESGPPPGAMRSPGMASPRMGRPAERSAPTRAAPPPPRSNGGREGGRNGNDGGGGRTSGGTARQRHP
jgi:hypothetical protein